MTISSREKESPIRKKSISYRKIIMGIIVAFVGIRLLWSLPITRQIAILLIGPRKEIPLPTLTAANAIRPETAANIRLLEHWEEGMLHVTGISDITITHDREIMAVSCSETTVNILELPSAISIKEWHFDEASCGQFLADTLTVAVGSPDQGALLYKIDEVTLPIKVKFPYCSACASFSSDGSVGARSSAVSSSGDPVVVTIWQRKFGLLQTWKFHNEGSHAFNMAVSPTGQYIAAMSPENTYLWVYGIQSGLQYPSLGPGIAFSPDEKYLASSYRILNLETGQIIKLEKIRNPKCSSNLRGTAAFSPDGQILAAEVCGTLGFWQVSNGALLAKLKDPYFSIHKLVFSSDGTFLAGLGEGSVNVWGIPQTGEE